MATTTTTKIKNKIKTIKTTTNGTSKNKGLLSKDFYTFWCAFSLFFGFVLVALPSMVAARRRQWHFIVHRCYRLWAKVLLAMMRTPVSIEFRAALDNKQIYIFTPNHSSYLDIPTMIYGIKPFFVFMGKSSLSKIPVFGYIFRKVHIPVNRENAKNSYVALEKAKEALAMRRNVLFFPEGGIVSTHPPAMSPFKDGAFRLAIETQTPIVPISLPYNYKILPDTRPMKATRHAIKIIFHEPIVTQGLTLADVEKLKKQVYDTINQELIYS